MPNSEGKAWLPKKIPKPFSLVPFRVLITFDQQWINFATAPGWTDIPLTYLHCAAWLAVRQMGYDLVSAIKRWIKEHITIGLYKPIEYTGTLRKSVGLKVGPGYYRFKPELGVISRVAQLGRVTIRPPASPGRLERPGFKWTPWISIGLYRKAPTPGLQYGAEDVQVYGPGIEFGRPRLGRVSLTKRKQLYEWLGRKFGPMPPAVFARRFAGLLKKIKFVGTVAQPFFYPAIERARKRAEETARLMFDTYLRQAWEEEAFIASMRSRPGGVRMGRLRLE